MLPPWHASADKPLYRLHTILLAMLNLAHIANILINLISSFQAFGSCM